MYSIHSVAYEQLADGEWIAYRDGEPPDRDGIGWQRHGFTITGRGKTAEEAEIDLFDRYRDWHDEPYED